MPATAEPDVTTRLPSARPEDVELVAIDDIMPWPGNPRRGKVSALRRMYLEFGQRRPVLVQRSSRRIVGGNHWWRAMVEEGATSILIVWVDVDDLQAERLGIADNLAHDVGTYDRDDLNTWLKSLYERGGLDDALGYTASQLEALTRRFGGAGTANPDEIPATPAAPWVLAGDLIKLGRHRILCADARESANWTRLLGGEQAAMIWTDPPYGADYVGRRGRDSRKPIAGDQPGTPLSDLLTDVLGCAIENLAEGRAIYVHAHAGAQLARAIDVAVKAAWYRQTIAWVKDTFVVGRSDFQYQWEPILYGWRPGASHAWYGDRRQSTVWPFDRPTRSDEHSTQKPVALVEHAITLSSAEGELVVDPFAGSGTLIVAAERASRVAYALELDPANVQVAVERWVGQTGGRPKVTHA